jgi:hypothetical protein
MLRTLLLALLAGIVGLPAFADQVTPSDRVETRLRVRAEPSTDSAINGHLLPGETAQLVSGVSHWWEIRLDDGTLGFVAKSWSRVIPDAAPSQILRLGAWNIKKLGHGSSKDFPLVAQVIESHFDIVAVVEVMQKQQAHPGFDNLLAALGTGWQGLVTGQPRPNTTSGNSEFYAVYFRPGLVSLCPGWSGLRYHVDHDGSASGSGSDTFDREPAFACFQTAAADGTVTFDFVLAAYHARWADGDIDDISDEVDELGDVFSAMGAAQPGERDLIIAGDFNLVPADLEDAVGREITTAGTGSTLNGQGDRTGNLYDHIVVDDPQTTAELIGSATVIDVRDVAADNETFFRTVSDHLPVVVHARRTGPDDD